MLDVVIGLRIGGIAERVERLCSFFDTPSHEKR
jgi:hypothetical protein